MSIYEKRRRRKPSYGRLPPLAQPLLRYQRRNEEDTYEDEDLEKDEVDDEDYENEDLYLTEEKTQRRRKSSNHHNRRNDEAEAIDEEDEENEEDQYEYEYICYPRRRSNQIIKRKSYPRIRRPLRRSENNDRNQRIVRRCTKSINSLENLDEKNNYLSINRRYQSMKTLNKSEQPRTRKKIFSVLDKCTSVYGLHNTAARLIQRRFRHHLEIRIQVEVEAELQRRLFYQIVQDIIHEYISQDFIFDMVIEILASPKEKFEPGINIENQVIYANVMSLIDVVTADLLRGLVTEFLNTLVDEFLYETKHSRGITASTNYGLASPVQQYAESICGQIVEEFLLEIVHESTGDMVNRCLVELKYENVYDKFLEDLVAETTIDVVEEISMDKFLDEVLLMFVSEASADIAKEMRFHQSIESIYDSIASELIVCILVDILRDVQDEILIEAINDLKDSWIVEILDELVRTMYNDSKGAWIKIQTKAGALKYDSIDMTVIQLMDEIMEIIESKVSASSLLR